MGMVDTPMPIVFPVLSLPYPAYETLDADGEKVATIMEVPVSGTLTHIAIGTQTVTTADADFSVRIETVSATDGKPSGTLYDASGTGTANLASSNSITEAAINSGTGITVTRHDKIAIVLTMTGACSLRVVKNSNIDGSAIAAGLPYGAYDLSAGSWALTEFAYFTLMKIDGIWYGIPYRQCAITYTSETIAQASGNNKERGIRLYMPYKVRAIGVMSGHQFSADAKFKFVLYSDPTGTPTEIAATTEQDADIGSSINPRGRAYHFTTPVDLTANTEYILAIQVTTTTSVIFYYHMTGSTDYNNAYHDKGMCGFWGRNDLSSAFSQTSDRVSRMALIYDQIDIPSGGSSPRFGDMTGGLR